MKGNIMAKLSSPGVTVSVIDQSTHDAAIPRTIPLIVFATRKNKEVSGIVAPGTTESNKLRLLTSQRDLLTNYGNPTFVTSGGGAANGDELNEYGLYAAYSFLGYSSRAYVIRADVNLDDLDPKTSEPTLPPADGTYWIPKDDVVGGIFKYDGANWNAVSFKVYTTTPTGADGADGDWAFDYSSINGTIMYRFGGIWKAASNTNLATDFGANVNLHVQTTTPTAPNSGDYWYKTTKSGGGGDLKLAKYRAVDGTFQTQVMVRDTVMPTPNEGTIWEDLSQIASTGNRPIYVGTGATFIPVPAYIQSTAPFTAPAAGTKWYDDTHSDFAMYVEGSDQGRGNEWVPVETTTVSNPSSTQKVISASAPIQPQESSIWIDISTPSNLDEFPVVKKYISGQWIDISDSIKIQETDPDATAVVNGTYWINTGESKTRYMVKEYDSSFSAVKVELNTTTNKYEVVSETGNYWKPIDKVFGRKSVRAVIVKAMQSAISSNQDVRAEDNAFHLITAPGYPELYDEMNTLNTDIGETAFIIVDPPKYANVSVVTGTTGRSISVVEWVTNSRTASVTGEDGFAASGSPYAATYYPWGVTSNVDGADIFVPPSVQVLRTIAYNDTVGYPWTAPAGLQRGRAEVFSSVGYLDENDTYVPIKITGGQADSLYINRINPILYKNGTLTIYGQKTLYGSTTALDRVNVARLVGVIKRTVHQSLQPFVFQINEAGSRRAAKNLVDRYLAGIMAKNGLYDFLTVCDTSNNPPNVIDDNTMVVDIFIKPAKVIEFINVNLTIVNTGDNLQ